MSSDSQKHINQGTASSTALLKARNAVRDWERKLEEAQKETDPKKREEKVREATRGSIDAQRNAALSIGAQFLKGDDKKRFERSIQAVALVRDLYKTNQLTLPDLDDLHFDPKELMTTVLSLNLSRLEGLAKSLGMEKEWGAVTALLGGANTLIDGDFSKLTLNILGGGLGLAGGIADLLGGNEFVSKARQAVDAAQKLQALFDGGDLVAGIDGILALDGLIPLPPELKEALKKAKDLLKRLKALDSLKPMVAKKSGVFVEQKHIAGLGLSGTEHGIPLSPGKGSPTVTAYDCSVWRTKSDLHVCPLIAPNLAPHCPPPGGKVPKGAKKTSADGLRLARHDDSTTEPNGRGLVKIIPLPEALAIALKRAAAEAERKRQEEAKKQAAKDAQVQAAKDKAAQQKAQQEKAAKEKADPQQKDQASQQEEKPPTQKTPDQLQKELDACSTPEDYEKFMRDNPNWTNGLPPPPDKITFDADGNPIYPPGWTGRDFKNDWLPESPHEDLEYPPGSGNKARYEMRSSETNPDQALPSAGTQAIYDQNGNLIGNEGTPDLHRTTSIFDSGPHWKSDYDTYNNMLNRLGPVEGDKEYRKLTNSRMPNDYYDQPKWQKKQSEWETTRAQGEAEIRRKAQEENDRKVREIEGRRKPGSTQIDPVTGRKTEY